MRKTAELLHSPRRKRILRGAAQKSMAARVRRERALYRKFLAAITD